MFGKIWAWLDGNKTTIGAIITIIGTTADQLAVILPAVVGPAKATQYLGGITIAVGLIHKAYKFIYKTDAPKA